MISILVISFRHECIPLVIKNLMNLQIPTMTFKDGSTQKVHHEFIIATHFNKLWFDILKVKKIKKVKKDDTIGYKRNMLMSEAKYHVKLFFDDDDYQMPDRIGTQVDWMIKNNYKISCPKNPLIYDLVLDKCIRSKHTKGVVAESGLCIFGNDFVFNNTSVYEGSFISDKIGYIPKDILIMIHHGRNTTKRTDNHKGIKDKKVTKIIKDFIQK